MELYVFNPQYEFVGIIEGYSSFRWIRRFYNCGEFELHIPINTRNLELLVEDNLILKNDDTEVAIITSRQLKLNTNGMQELTIHGRFMKYIFNRRIIWDTVNYNNNLTELIMIELVNKNVINPTNVNRKIQNIQLGVVNNFTDTLSKQISYKDLLDSLFDITTISNISFKLDFNINDKKLYFNTFKGLDRTVGQNTNIRAIFSTEFDNILEQEYTDSNENFKNTVLIAGEGQGTQRKKVVVGEDNSGIARKEMFIDARDIQSDNTDVTLTQEQYNNILITKGVEALKQCTDNYSFNSVINTNQTNLTYKKDYDLGDIVTCVNTDWGLQVDTRITEIEEVYENGTIQINVVFGNELPTLIDKLKFKLKN
ncbi:virus ReqiPepy6 Gp37-like protein [Hathewaya proteolytica DSM 3090]|uniref:Virus ReqiPepy6 Gp37-like protein n=1 Tax=Hathewaya proteolytica DSM 3090 TaxID=1121331 RepID=A0A1M6L0E8_9CLOT|nr:siphovirus ReqiPepy6 Gp37-like family protein [Hathewaya proteolytica]SHJ64653.1 virus ReqiPepy6 Gp37-like protein [Hathewaya proteolytica DSM 3090]